jgi:hypothetical protein
MLVLQLSKSCGVFLARLQPSDEPHKPLSTSCLLIKGSLKVQSKRCYTLVLDKSDMSFGVVMRSAKHFPMRGRKALAEDAIMSCTKARSASRRSSTILKLVSKFQSSEHAYTHANLLFPFRMTFELADDDGLGEDI